MALADHQPSGLHEVDFDQDFKKLIGSNFCRAFPLPTGANDNDAKFSLLLDAIRHRCPTGR